MAEIDGFVDCVEKGAQPLASFEDGRRALILAEAAYLSLREGRLVDLYRVVGSGLALAVPSYSIKKVEAYYRGARAGAVANAGESIVMYEAFRETTDARENGPAHCAGTIQSGCFRRRSCEGLSR